MPKGLSLKDIADRVRRGVDITGAKILTVLDMGSGNGLDADTVDGLEASAFATASHTHTESDITDLGTYLTDITGESIEDLSDVNAMVPTNGQVLTWDGTNSRWDASDISGGGSFVTNGTDPACSTNAFNVVSSVTASTSETVGPTGSGADNIWTALDSVAADSTWIEVRIIAKAQEVSGTAGQTKTQALYARDGDGTALATDQKMIHYAEGFVPQNGTAAYRTVKTGAVTVHKIPIETTNLTFSIRWDSTFTSNTLTLYLVGYG
jgi:hypothetical protein